MPSVFNAKAKEHAKFVPVLNWVTRGAGKFVYGGTKYISELRHLDRYFRLIIELTKQGKVVKVPSEPVDNYAKALKIKVPDVAFDDEHIVALVAISGCRIVCTNDKRSHLYLRRSDLYPKGVKVPKIYSSSSHAKLCCDAHLVGICKDHK